MFERGQLVEFRAALKRSPAAPQVLGYGRVLDILHDLHDEIEPFVIVAWQDGLVTATSLWSGGANLIPVTDPEVLATDPAALPPGDFVESPDEFEREIAHVDWLVAKRHVRPDPRADRVVVDSGTLNECHVLDRLLRSPSIRKPPA